MEFCEFVRPCRFMHVLCSSNCVRVVCARVVRNVQEESAVRRYVLLSHPAHVWQKRTNTMPRSYSFRPCFSSKRVMSVHIVQYQAFFFDTEYSQYHNTHAMHYRCVTVVIFVYFANTYDMHPIQCPLKILLSHTHITHIHTQRRGEQTAKCK